VPAENIELYRPPIGGWTRCDQPAGWRVSPPSGNSAAPGCFPGDIEPLAHLTPHDLRQTHASLLFALGEPPTS
jgi:hypothetical protein